MGWCEDNIESAIRPAVVLLRENGFNTYSSCGHEMWICVDLWEAAEVDRLAELLIGAGYTDFGITYHLGVSPLPLGFLAPIQRRRAEVHFQRAVRRAILEGAL